MMLIKKKQIARFTFPKSLDFTCLFECLLKDQSASNLLISLSYYNCAAILTLVFDAVVFPCCQFSVKVIHIYANTMLNHSATFRRDKDKEFTVQWLLICFKISPFEKETWNILNIILLRFKLTANVLFELHGSYNRYISCFFSTCILKPRQLLICVKDENL